MFIILKSSLSSYLKKYLLCDVFKLNNIIFNELKLEHNPLSKYYIYLFIYNYGNCVGNKMLQFKLAHNTETIKRYYDI